MNRQQLLHSLKASIQSQQLQWHQAWHQTQNKNIQLMETESWIESG
jgi:hypothetical protein